MAIPARLATKSNVSTLRAGNSRWSDSSWQKPGNHNDHSGWISDHVHILLARMVKPRERMHAYGHKRVLEGVQHLAISTPGNRRKNVFSSQPTMFSAKIAAARPIRPKTRVNLRLRAAPRAEGLRATICVHRQSVPARSRQPDGSPSDSVDTPRALDTVERLATIVLPMSRPNQETRTTSSPRSIRDRMEASVSCSPG